MTQKKTVGAAIQGVDLTSTRGIRFNSFYTKQQEELHKQQREFLPRAHVSPNSVLVAPIGVMWEGHSFEKVTGMVEHHHSAGFLCWLEEIPDPCVHFPHLDLGQMMDEAVIRAQGSGVEWVCLLHTDILPEPQLLTELMTPGAPVIAPATIHPDTGASISGPNLKPGQGIKLVRWFPWSFMLFRLSVFNCFPGERFFHGDSLEGPFFNRLWHYGHSAWLDTDHVLEMATQPSYAGRQTWNEFMDRMEQVHTKRLETPNRALTVMPATRAERRRAKAEAKE